MWTSKSQPIGDGTSGDIPKDVSKVRSLTKSISGQIKSLYLDYDLTNVTS